ncbi:RidA family protein [Nocardioides cavernae]|uniref:RidA family protein n=1 Tax=Nocardioides cavernae TaxID=1921566 RepID=A0ABR8N8J7_9ACTN|nr:RidA family protein [Nocardioides cavernae]MBD3924205.1 RidA family protein [Nocardioides cavernae]MBM7510857.1 2-iminobutanoate/2-iminopropanoate deaminase [Nocardioides cavernae]
MSWQRKTVTVPSELLTAIEAESEWSDAVVTGPMIYAAGQLGWDKTTGVFAEGIEAQAELALQNVEELLERAGASLSDVVHVRTYLTDANDYHRYEPVFQRFFPTDPPARVSIVVAQNIHDALINFEIVAIKTGSTQSY